MDCYIAFGTNLGQRRRNLEAGLSGLLRADCSPVAQSSIWETEPVDSPGTPWFWNMVVHVRTAQAPLPLLDALLRIEHDIGRVRDVPNAPRILDLDLLLMGDLRMQHPRLELPHPRMWQRSFVLEPLAEIAADLLNPISGRSVAQERERLESPSDVRRLGSLACCASAQL